MHKKFSISTWESLYEIPRRLSIAPPVMAIGDLREKRLWEKRNTFYVCSFSFILRGEGQYRIRRRSWQVAAPCVVTQFSGYPIEYGPAGHWDEIFIAYGQEQLGPFKEGGVDLIERPVWRIHRPEAVGRSMDELFRLLVQGNIERVIDLVDALCLRIVTDSLLPGAAQLSPAEEAVNRVRMKVDDDLFTGWTTRDLAREANMSLSTFRRYWLKCVGMPPQQYILERKIEMARQMLLNSSLRCGEIATVLHFENYFYFSRLFKKKTGLSPAAFRRRRAGIRQDDE